MSDQALRLQVIFSTVDKLTAPLKKISGESTTLGKALKATHGQLKELNAQQKNITHFRELHTNLSATSLKLTGAQQRVHQLAQQLQQTTHPPRAMTREFNAAVKVAANLKQSHRQQSEQLQTLRGQLSAVGISTGNLSQHERTLRTSLAATNNQLAEQQKRLTALHTQQQKISAARQHANQARKLAGNLSGAGIGASVAGGVMGLPLIKGLHEAKHYQTEVGRIHSLGLGQSTSDQAVAFARNQSTYGTSQLDNLTLLRDGMTAFADLHHAEMVAPLLAKMKFGNHAFYGEETGAENERKFMDMLKVIELRGGLSSQASFEAQANMVQKVITATGGRVGSGEWLNLIKTGGLAAKGLRDDAFYYQLEPLVQEMGGHRVGTALMSTYQNLYQGHTTKRSMGKLDEFGLIGDKSKVMHDKVGQIAYLNPGALLGAELFRTSPFAWMENILLPQLAKKGITENDAILDAIGALFSNRTASNLFSQMYLQRQQIHKNANLNSGAYDINQLSVLGKETLSGKELEFKAKLADLNLTLGEKILPLVSSAIENVTTALKSFNSMMENNPALAKAMLVSLSVLASVLVILSPLMLGLATLIAPYAMLHMLFAKIGVSGGVLLPVLRGIGSAFTWLGSTLLLLGRTLLMNPLGLAITALAVSAYLIYQYWEPIKQFFSELWNSVNNTFDQAYQTLSGVMLKLWNNIRQTVTDTINWFCTLPERLFNIGGQLMQGLADGITGSLGLIKSTITNAADNVINWFKNKLGIHSPSRVFAELGEYTMQGFALGLQRDENTSLSQLKNFSKRFAQLGAGIAISTTAMSGMDFDERPLTFPRSNSAAMTMQGDTIHITINPSAGMDEIAIANTIAQLLEQRDRQKAARRRSGLADY